MINSTNRFLTITDPGQREIIEAAAAISASLKMNIAIVGGFIRDSLLDRPVRDLDLAVEGDARYFSEALASSLGSPKFVLHLEAGMYRLTPRGQAFDQIDIGQVAGTLDADLMRRDFTVDAMAAPIPPGLKIDCLPILDPSNGIEDLKYKIIRAVAANVFESDPARLLRGIRLAAEIGFKIEPVTESLIAANAPLVENVAGERTREDLVKVFSLPSVGPTVEYLDRLGLLTHIFPELEPSRGVDQPIEHNWDVLGHQLKTVSALDWVLRRGEWPYAPEEAQTLIPWTKEIATYFEASPNSGGASRLALIRIAALIHDIAKPETKTLAPNGRVRFYGHPVRGAETATAMLSRLRFSQKEIKFIATLVELHMRPTQMGPDSITPTPKAVYRFMRDAGNAAIATLYLSLADHLAARGPTLVLDNFREHVTIVAYVLSEYGRQLEKAPKRLVDGNNLQSRFGLKPGPELGVLLEELVEAQATGEISTKEEGLALAERLIESQKSESGKP